MALTAYADYVEWSVHVCVPFRVCMLTVNLIAVKPNACFCWGLTVCQLTKCLTCFYLHHADLVRRQTYFHLFHLSLAHPEATDCDCNYFSLKLWGSFRFCSHISHSFWISFVWFCHLTTLNPFSVFTTEWGLRYSPLPPLLFLLLLFLVVPLLHPHVEEISNRTVYWASLLSSPKSALLLWKAVILLLVGSPYRQPQYIREKRCMILSS